MCEVVCLKKEDAGFPDRLKDIEDAPEELYYQGNPELFHTKTVAVVGSRKCTPYGMSVARRIGKRCAECGITLVSGMALGIDTAAHLGVLEGGGNTIAVFGCGIDICYPRTNRKLMEEIKRKGLIFTEYSPGTKPAPFRFPNRNRLISGISDAVVVVEAGERSGSLITAEFAVEQGKELFAVPGNITSLSSMGCNKLIGDGIPPLVVIEDLFRQLGQSCIDKKTLEKLSEDEKIVYEEIVCHSEMTTDDLCRITMFSAQRINGLITVLEMKGLVISSMGRVYVNVM